MRRLWPMLLLPGCTFAPGGGFTAVTAGSLLAALGGAELETADGQVVALSSATLSVEAIELQALQGAEGVDFDPADPPEGYSLCHGEHCHSDSGALVSYDAIIAELSGGAASFVAVGELAGVSDLDLLSGAPAALAGETALPLGDLSRVTLSAPLLKLSGTAGDGTAVLVALELDTPLAGELLHSVTRTGPAEARIDVDADVPETLLSGLDLGALGDGAGVVVDDPDTDAGAAIAEVLRTSVVHGTLSPVD